MKLIEQQSFSQYCCHILLTSQELCLMYQSLKQQSAIGHFPTNLPQQIRFARPYLLYISNEETIDNLFQCSCFQGTADQFQIVISGSDVQILTLSNGIPEWLIVPYTTLTVYKHKCTSTFQSLIHCHNTTIIELVIYISC